MVGPRIYHLKHARAYPAFNAQDPSKVMDLAIQWLKRHDFRVKRKDKQYSRGSKKGIHVNFVPKFKLIIEQGPNGQYVVRFDYYAKIKLGTAVVVGVLTSGISTVVGVGTLAITLADADNFVEKFWKHIDSLARGNAVILTVERWASDGKGNFVKQPPVGPVPVVAAPPPQPVHVVHHQPPPHPAQYHNVPPPPPPIQAPPPQPQLQNIPRSQPNSTPIQPGQVYGHSGIQFPQVQSTAPVPTPQFYPQLEKANGHPTQNASYQSPQPHGNYPPPQQQQQPGNYQPTAPQYYPTPQHSSYQQPNNFQQPSPVHSSYASTQHSNYQSPAQHNYYPTTHSPNPYASYPTPASSQHNYPAPTPSQQSNYPTLSPQQNHYPTPASSQHSNYPPPATSQQGNYPPPPPSRQGNQPSHSDFNMYEDKKGGSSYYPNETKQGAAGPSL